MKIGVFCPIEIMAGCCLKMHHNINLALEIDQTDYYNWCETLWIRFLLSLIKHKYFGGKTEFWDHNHETFALMARAGSGHKRNLCHCGSEALIHTAYNCVHGIDHWFHFKWAFGLNVVTGWHSPEYKQMGMCRDEYFAKRLWLFVGICGNFTWLWATGQSDFKGMNISKWMIVGSVRVHKQICICCVRRSDTGLEFSAKYANYNFNVW